MLRLGIVPGDRQQRAIESIYENAKLQQQLIAEQPAQIRPRRAGAGQLRVDVAAGVGQPDTISRSPRQFIEEIARGRT